MSNIVKPDFKAFDGLDRAEAAVDYACALLEEEALQLDDWAEQSRKGGWSTHQVDPMRKRADHLRREASQIRRAWWGALRPGG